MRRIALLLLVALLGAPLGASAQVRATASVTLDSTGRLPVVQLSRLFEEGVWRDAIEQGVAVMVQWELTLWKKGRLWDDRIRTQEWQDIVRHQVLLDQYDVRRLSPARGVEAPEYFSSLDRLSFERFTQPLLVRLPLPSAAGEYYYSMTVRIETRSGEDVDRKLRATGQNANLWLLLTRPVSNAFLPTRSLPIARTPDFRLP